MDQAQQIDHIKTLLARLDSGTNVDAGGLRLNPTSAYVDSDLAEQEWQTFFVDHPQMIGLSADIPNPGSYITVNDLAVPILATRDDDGSFRAFVNSCRHRGVIVETGTRGETRRFTCQFHSWVYGLDGTLVGLPKQDHFGDVDLDCHGLIELPSLEQDGLLWVHTRTDGTIDLQALLGDELTAEIADWNLADMAYLADDSYDVRCNWKLAMDTFGETYHFNSLHKDTLAAGFHGNVQCYDTFGRNHRMLLCRRAIDDMRHRPEDSWNIAEATLPVYWLFPNIQLMPFGAGVYLVRAYPVPGEPGRHTSRITFYYRPGMEERFAGDGDLSGIEVQRAIAENFANVIRDEDYAMSASQQRSAEAGAMEHVVFGRNEPALHHYHNTYRAALGMDPLPLVDSV